MLQRRRGAQRGRENPWRRCLLSVCVVPVLGWWNALGPVDAVADDYAIGLAAVTNGVERDKGEALRAGAQAALAYLDKHSSENEVLRPRVVLNTEEAPEDPRSRAQLLRTLISGENVVAVIAGMDGDARLGRGFAEMQEVLIMNTSPVFDPSRSGQLSVHIGRPLRSAVQTLKQFIRDQVISCVWVVSADVNWDASTTVVVQALKSQGLSVRSFVGPDGRSELRKLDPALWQTSPGGSPEAVVLVGSRPNGGLSGIVESGDPGQPVLVTLFGCEPRGAGDATAPYYSIDPQIGKESEKFRWVSSYISERHHPSLLRYDALVAFDAVLMLSQALQKESLNGSTLRRALVASGSFDGASGKITFAQDGSSQRETVLSLVTNGECREVPKSLR